MLCVFRHFIKRIDSGIGTGVVWEKGHTILYMDTTYQFSKLIILCLFYGGA